MPLLNQCRNLGPAPAVTANLPYFVSNMSCMNNTIPVQRVSSTKPGNEGTFREAEVRASRTESIINSSEMSYMQRVYAIPPSFISHAPPWAHSHRFELAIARAFGL